jgi:hypothetical protein
VGTCGFGGIATGAGVEVRVESGAGVGFGSDSFTVNIGRLEGMGGQSGGVFFAGGIEGSVANGFGNESLTIRTGRGGCGGLRGCTGGVIVVLFGCFCRGFLGAPLLPRVFRNLEV